MRIIKDNGIDFEKYMAEPEEAADIKPASEWCQGVIDRMYDDSINYEPRLPWAKTHERIRLRPGEVSIWSGYNSQGKSLMLNQVMLSIMDQGEKVCIASLEMKPTSTMYRMTRQATALNEPSIPFIKQFHSWTDGRLWVYDQYGTVKSERVLAMMRYCSEELGINHIVIDSLMKCGIKPDDFNRQKEFVDQICSHGKDTGTHIHLVAHSRKGMDETKPPGKYDIKGTSEISDLPDNVFITWRNKPKERAQAKGDDSKDNDPDCLLSMEKQRHGEWEGRIALWFDEKSMQYVQGSSEKPSPQVCYEEGAA